MAGAGKGALRIAIEDFLKTWGFGKIFSGWLKDELETQERNIFGEFPVMFAELDLDPELKRYLDFEKMGKEKGQHQGGALSLMGFAAQAGGGASSALLGPILKKVNYNIEHSQQSARLDISQGIAINWRDPIYQDMVKSDLADMGWTTGRRDALQELMRPRMSEQSWLMLRLRGLTSYPETRDELRARGWLDADLARMELLQQQIPGPGDLISMAVREAWNEQVVARFEYDKDLPSEFVSWMAKQGYSSDWSKRYWRQHWTIPGVAQGYEMLHRLREGESDTPFTGADMEMLLKTADVPEFFRRRLIAISYNPYTRVDVRRLYGTGILTEAQVKSNYLDLGYDEEHATNLTKFTTAGAKAEEKGITPSVITNLYRDAVLSRGDALAMLVDLGYSTDNAEYLLLLVDVDMDRADSNAQLADIQTRYINGELDESSLAGALGQLNLPSDRVTRLLTSWQIAKRNKLKKPSSSQLESWYKLNLATRDDYLAGLLRAGYNQADAETFVAATDLKQQSDAMTAVAAAQRTANTAAATPTASDARRQLAQLDVDIAYDRLQIANCKVALHGELDDDAKQNLRDTIDILTVGIAKIDYSKALIRLGAL